MTWDPEQGGPECHECGAQLDPDYDGTCKNCGASDEASEFGELTDLADMR